MTIPRHQPNLFGWREATGLYQREAAQIAGISLSAWRNYENGRRPVPQWLMTVLMARHPIRRSAMWGDRAERTSQGR
jgi:DNA-binding XRE family transcriptional regulator